MQFLTPCTRDPLILIKTSIQWNPDLVMEKESTRVPWTWTNLCEPFSMRRIIISQHRSSLVDIQSEYVHRLSSSGINSEVYHLMITTDTVNARVYIPFCEADNRLALCIMWAPFMTLLYGPSPEIIAVSVSRQRSVLHTLLVKDLFLQSHRCYSTLNCTADAIFLSKLCNFRSKMTKKLSSGKFVS